MKFDEAAEASPHKKSTYVKGGTDGPPPVSWELYDGYSKSFFMVRFEQNGTYVVDRKIGRGSRNVDEWLPLNEEKVHERVEAWKAEQEDRPIVPEKKWEEACMASPINRCFRIKTGDGLMMIRNGNGTTFTEEFGGAMVNPVAGPFRAFDGWEPMPEDHYYAGFDFSASSTVRYPEGGRLGKAYKPKKPMKKGMVNPSAPPVKIDPRVYTSVDVMVQALAGALPNLKSQGDQSKVIDELLKLSRTLGWHLREDRGKYQNPGDS